MSTKIALVLITYCFFNALSAQTYAKVDYLDSNKDLAVYIPKTNEAVASSSDKVIPAKVSYFTNTRLNIDNDNFQIATLKYTLAQAERISILLLDADKRPVKTYTRGAKRAPGTYQQEIHLPIGLPKGTYYLSISSPNGRTLMKVGE